MEALPLIMRDVRNLKSFYSLCGINNRVVVHCNEKVLQKVILEDRKKRFPSESQENIVKNSAVAFILCKRGSMAYIHEGIKFRFDERAEYYELKMELPE